MHHPLLFRIVLPLIVRQVLVIPGPPADHAPRSRSAPAAPVFRRLHHFNRYDPVRRVRQTTVELMVEEMPWTPPAAKAAFVRVGWRERDLRRSLKERGARWNKVPRRWETTRDVVRELKLENRLD